MRPLLTAVLLLFAVRFAGAAEPPRVAATLFPLHLIAQAVAGPGSPVDLLMPAGVGCPHDHALTVAERAAIARTQVVVLNGLGLDGAVADLLTPAQVAVDTSDAWVALRLPAQTDDDHPHDHHGHDHDHHEHGQAFNPHGFASPLVQAAIARDLGRRLPGPDAEGRRARAEALAQRLEALVADGRRRMGGASPRPVILQHDALAYLLRDLGLPVVAVIQGEAGEDPPASRLGTLVDLARRTKALVVTEPQYPSEVARTLATEAGCPLVTLDPVASGPADATVDHYLATMATNLNLLEQALSRP